MNAPVFHEGEWNLCDVSSPDLIAWRWRHGAELRVIVVCLDSAPKEGQVDIAAALPGGDAFVFEDLLIGARYDLSRAALESTGLYVRLDAHQAHVFAVTTSA